MDGHKGAVKNPAGRLYGHTAQRPGELSWAQGHTFCCSDISHQTPVSSHLSQNLRTNTK